MTDVNADAPADPTHESPSPELPSIVGGLIAEAEAASRRIAVLRRDLGAAELRRRKLLVAINAAVEALPPGLRAEHQPRLARLAEAVAPPRGRRPDSRLAAVLERLAWLANHDEMVVKVADMQAHLERLGHAGLPSGYASNALAGLAERGVVAHHSYGRWRIHDVHPEIVALRIGQIKGLVEENRGATRDMREAERLGRRRVRRGR